MENYITAHTLFNYYYSAHYIHNTKLFQFHNNTNQIKKGGGEII